MLKVIVCQCWWYENPHTTYYKWIITRLVTEKCVRNWQTDKLSHLVDIWHCTILQQYCMKKDQGPNIVFDCHWKEIYLVWLKAIKPNCHLRSHYLHFIANSGKNIMHLICKSSFFLHILFLYLMSTKQQTWISKNSLSDLDVIILKFSVNIHVVCLWSVM